MTDRNKLICLLTKIVPLPFKSITAIAEKLVENGVGYVTDNNVGKWIPVTERLPDYGQEVIAYSGNILKPCVYGCFYWNKDFQNWAHVTHWMPLPDAPEEV